MKSYFRITFDGYIEGEFESEEEAIAEMNEMFNDDYRDHYGRAPSDLFTVERFNNETEEWE